MNVVEALTPVVSSDVDHEVLILIHHKKHFEGLLV